MARLEPGRVWVNTKSHVGHVARITKVSPEKVTFVYIKGPHHAKGRQERLSRAAFLNCFRQHSPTGVRSDRSYLRSRTQSRFCSMQSESGTLQQAEDSVQRHLRCFYISDGRVTPEPRVRIKPPVQADGNAKGSRMIATCRVSRESLPPPTRVPVRDSGDRAESLAHSENHSSFPGLPDRRPIRFLICPRKPSLRWQRLMAP